MGKFLRKLFLRRNISALIVLFVAFSLVAPGFAYAASGPTITLTSGTTYSSSNPSLSLSVSSTVALNSNSASMTIDGQSVNVYFSYTGHWDTDDCGDGTYVVDDTTSGTISGTPSNLHDGSHTVVVSISDNDGFTTTKQWAINVNHIPTLTSPNPANGSETADNSGFSVKYNDNDAIDQSSIVATLDNVQVLAVFDSSTSMITYKSSTILADGVHSVTVNAKDTTGNPTSLSWNFTVSTSGPQMTFTSAGYTFNSMPTLQVSLSSLVKLKNSNYTFKIDGQSVNAYFSYSGHWDTDDCGDSTWVLDSYDQGTLTYTPTQMSDGTHTLQVTAQDITGASTTEQWNFNILTRPSLSQPSPADGTYTRDNSGFFVKVSSNGGSVDQSSIVAILDNVQVPVSFDASTGTIFYKSPNPIPDGKHTINVSVANTSGLSSSLSWSYTIKATGPSLIFSGSGQTFTSVPSITVNVSSDVKISNSGYTFKLDGHPVNAYFSYSGHWDTDDCGDTYWVLDSYNQGTLTYTPSTLTDGTHILSVTAKDYLGNTTTKQWTFTTQNSTKVSFSNPSNNSTTNGTLSLTGTTNLDKMNLSATKIGTNNVINIGDKTGTNATWNWDTTKVSDGEYVLTLTGYDTVGNSITSQINVKVQNVTQGLGLDNKGTVDNHIGTVNITNGNFVVSQTDINLPGKGLGTDFTRVYNSQMKTNGVLGWGWRIDVPVLSLYSDGSVVIVDGNGAKHTYTENSIGNYIGSKGDYDILTKDADGIFTLKSKDGSKYVFDLANNKVSEIDKNNNTVVYQYDTNNRLTSITDPTNRVTNLSYDSNTGKLTSVKDYASRNWNYSYDTNGNLVKVSDPLQHSQTFAYASNHQLISVTDANGNTTNLTYTGNQLTGVTDPSPLSYKTTYSYDGSNNQFVETDGNRNATKYIYDTNGNVKSVIDAENNTTAYTYDANYNVLTETDALGNITTYTYDSMGNQLTVTDPMNHTTTYTYDTNNNMLTRTDALGTVANYTYDANGNQISDGTNGYTYNADGTVATEKDANGNITKYSYDSNGNVISQTDALNNQTQMTYDAVENKISETDATGNTTTYTYDALGYTLTVTAGGKTTSYTYDANGNKLTLTAADGNVTTWSNDALNRVVTENDPGNTAQSTTYDANNNVMSKTAADGTVTNYTYDSLNRQTQVKNPDGTSVSYTYDAVGTRSSMTDSTGTTTYQYDKDGNLTKLTDPTGKITTYSYNADNQQNSKVVDGKSFSYNYDSQGNLTSMVESNNLTTGFSYDVNKNKTAVNYANGTKINYGYDASNEVTDVSNLGQKGNVIANFHYTYGNGQIQSITDSNGVTSYGYDGQNRLLKITAPTGNVTEYTYDSLGNRISTSITVNGVKSTTSYTYDITTNVLTKITNPDGSTISYTYDVNGNTLSKTDSTGITKFEYNSNNQLIKVTKPNGEEIQYAYDGENKRISKTVNGVVTKYDYDGNLLNKATDASGNVIARYSYDDKGTPVSVTEGGKVYNYQYNGHGDVVALTDSNGNVVVTYAYDVWGNVTAKTGSIDNLYGYAGEFGYVYDQETGYYFLKSRYYNPEIGRFTTKDRFKGFEDDPQSLNQYIYVKNNPIMNVDPTGFFYVSLSNMGKVLAAIGINPLASVVIGIGLYRLTQYIKVQWGLLMVRLGSFVGGAVGGALGVIAWIISLPSISSVSYAIFECFMQGKRGIDFGLKYSRWGWPYAIAADPK